MDEHEEAAAPAPQTGAAVVAVLRRLVTWDADGNPVVTTEKQLNKGALQDLYMVAAAQPYVVDPHDPQDAQYEGMTCAEVMVRKQTQTAARLGDAEVVMDRLLGRPKQSVESTKLTLTYEDTLKEIARKELLKGNLPDKSIYARAIPAEDIFS